MTRTATTTLIVRPTDFSVTANPPYLTYPASGGPAARTVTVTTANGFVKTVNLSAGSLPAGGSVGFVPASITGGGNSSMTVTLPSGLTPWTYPASVIGSVIDPPNGNPTRSSPIGLIVYTGDPLASPWTGQDIGGVGIPGAAGASNGTFTVQGGGQDVYTGDSFRYVGQPLTGDGTIVARVTNTQASTPFSSAGLMIRENLTAGAMQVSISGLNQALLYARTATSGSNTLQASGPSLTNGSTWVRLTRQGNNFTAFHSPDGAVWTQLGGTVTVAMPGSAYAGFFVDSASTNGITTVSMDNVAILGAGADFFVTPSASSVSAPASVESTHYVSLRVTPVNGFAANSTLAVSGLPGTVTASFFNSTVASGGTGNLQLAVGAGTAAGTYPFTVTATSGSIVRTVNLTLKVAAGVTALPTPWASGVVGSGIVEGSTAMVNGIVTVNGAGNLLNTGSDQARYAYQTMDGDGTFIARLSGFTFNGNPGDLGKTGLMLRESLFADSVNVCLCRHWSGTYVQYRGATGATATLGTPAAPLATPIWIRVDRLGSQFTTYASADGVNWGSAIGSVTVSAMPSKVYVGFPATSESATNLLNATFDNFRAYQGQDLYLVTTPPTQSYSLGTSVQYHTVSTVAMNGLGGTVSFSMTGLPSGASATFTPPTVSAGGTTQLRIATTAATGAGTYNPQIVATVGALTRMSPITMVVNGTEQSLPSQWTYDAVGGTPASQSATNSNGTYTLSGTLCCIADHFSSSADAFHFAYQQLTGDGQITARLVSATDTARAGLMFRESLAGNAPSVFANYTSFRRRPTTGGTVMNQGSGSPVPPSATYSLPAWIKLVRKGNVFTMYSSPDNVAWYPVYYGISVTMASTVYVGLAVNGTAMFDNVSISQSTDFLFDVSHVEGYTMDPVGTSHTLSVAPLVGSPGNVTLSVQSGLPPNVTVSFSPSTIAGGEGTSTVTFTALPAAVQGDYPVTIAASNGTVVRTRVITLRVRPGFNLTVSPTPVWTGGPGISTGSNDHIFTLTVTAVGGFNSVVTFGASVSLNGSGKTFSPTTVTGSGTSTWFVGLTGGPGLSLMRFSATGGGVTRTFDIPAHSGRDSGSRRPSTSALHRPR